MKKLLPEMRLLHPQLGISGSNFRKTRNLNLLLFLFFFVVLKKSKNTLPTYKATNVSPTSPNLIILILNPEMRKQKYQGFIVGLEFVSLFEKPQGKKILHFLTT